MMTSHNIFRISEEDNGSTEDEKILEVKKGRGRPRLGAEAKNKQEDYYRNYYHEKRKLKITCDKCGCEVSKNQYSKHIKSLKCQLAVLKKN